MAHSADADLFAYVGGRLLGSRVADCGCGPGLLSEKLANRGVSHLMAIDGNASMVRQAAARLAPFIESGVVDVVHRFIDPSFFDDLHASFDLIVFKRSLYASRPESIAMLRAAVGALGPHGVVVVVHPERSLRRYALGDPPRIRRDTVFHLVNRLISVVAVWLGISEYRTYSAVELVDLLTDAVPKGRIDIVPTTQHGYNIAALVNTEQWSAKHAANPLLLPGREVGMNRRGDSLEDCSADDCEAVRRTQSGQAGASRYAVRVRT